MKTKIIKPAEFDLAVQILQHGGLVAVPTETVYGLAANGLNSDAVDSIFAVKGRPPNKALSLLVPDKYSLYKYCENVPDEAFTLADAFWPGPLTIVLKAKSIIPSNVLAGGDTVGLRCPDHPVTLKLLEKANIPLAAPSANPFSKTSPKSASEVLGYFDGLISAVIDGGRCSIGIESSLIAMDKRPYRVLRDGALSKEQIADVLASKMLIIGVTGGSGSGKSVLTKTFSDSDSLCVDCDTLYHELLSENSELKKELSEAFPGCFTDGKIDTRIIAAFVFNDDKQRLLLNSITHKHIHSALIGLIREHAMNGGKRVIIDAYALFESGASNMCDLTIGVIADKETRLSRVMARDGVEIDYASSRINAQQDNSFYNSRCDYLIENSSDLESFVLNINKLKEEILS